MLDVIFASALFLGGSDSPTPYTVDEKGITLEQGQTFQDNGHINIKTSAGDKSLHFEGKCIDRTDAECAGARHEAAQYIGKSHIPWSAFGLKDDFCVTWVQSSAHNEHFGEGDQKPVCNTPVVPEEPTIPEEPETPVEPEEPVIPEVPTEPEMPVIPEEPTEPEIPIVPEVPSEPVKPSPEPELPEEPSLPAVLVRTPETPVSVPPVTVEKTPPTTATPRQSLPVTGVGDVIGITVASLLLVGAGVWLVRMARRSS